MSSRSIEIYHHGLASRHSTIGFRSPSDRDWKLLVALFRSGHEVPDAFVDAEVAESDPAGTLQIDRRFSDVPMDEVVLVHEGQGFECRRDVVTQRRQIDREVLRQEVGEVGAVDELFEDPDGRGGGLVFQRHPEVRNHVGMGQFLH